MGSLALSSWGGWAAGPTPRPGGRHRAGAAGGLRWASPHGPPARWTQDSQTANRTDTSGFPERARLEGEAASFGWLGPGTATWHFCRLLLGKLIGSPPTVQGGKHRPHPLVGGVWESLGAALLDMVSSICHPTAGCPTVQPLRKPGRPRPGDRTVYLHTRKVGEAPKSARGMSPGRRRGVGALGTSSSNEVG